MGSMVVNPGSRNGAASPETGIAASRKRDGQDAAIFFLII
jgi:hypothetical protein